MNHIKKLHITSTQSFMLETTVAKRLLGLFVLLLFYLSLLASPVSLRGVVVDDFGPVPYATVLEKRGKFALLTDDEGVFVVEDLALGVYHIEISSVGYRTYKEKVELKSDREEVELQVYLAEDTQVLEEFIVTGISRSTLIRENPIPVTALTYEEINQNPQSNVIDALLKNSTGLTVLKTGPNISKPFIRGLGYNRVLTLFDGIRQEGQEWGDEHGLEIDDYNIGRAEVIKGPSSLMFGSDALAGVISFYSHIPSREDGKLYGNYISEYHTNNGLLANAFRVEYSNPVYRFALSGSHRMAQNYRNPVDGRVYSTNFRELNLTALAGIKSSNGYSNLSFTMYDNKQGIPDGSRDPDTREFTKQIYEDDLDDDENRPVVSRKELNSYQLPDIYTNVQHYRLYLNSFYELEQGEITVNLAGQQNVRREFNHPTAREQAGMYIRLNSLNYDIRYNAPVFAGIEFITGTNGIVQANRVLDATEIPIPDFDLFDFGYYVFNKWKKNKWTVSGGVRYDLRSEGWDDLYIGVDPISGFTKRVGADASDAVLEFPAFKKNFHDVSASVGSTYRINQQLSLKASVGRAFRAPNITELASNGLDPGAGIYYKGDRTFNPEVSVQQDLGMSANYKNVSGEISLFHNRISNFIYLKAVEGDDGNPKTDHQGNRYYDYKQSKAELYGGEFWFAIHPEAVKGLRFTNSIALVYGFNRDEEFKGKGVMGEYLPLIAPLNLRSVLSYDFVVNKSYLNSLKTTVDMEYSAKQNRYLGLSGTETATKGYTLFNAGIVADIPYTKSNNLQLMLQANNIFNVAYQAHLSRLKYLEDHDGPGIFNMGRNLIVKLIVPFG